MFCRLVICLLNCVTETIQVTEGRKYFSRGWHIGQPWFTTWHISRVVSLFRDSSTLECSIQKVLGKERENLHFCIGLSEQKINCSSSISSLDYTRYQGRKSIPVAVQYKAVGLQSLDCWDRGFESRLRHECSSLVLVVHCVDSGMCDELITRSGETYPVYVCVCLIVCDLGASITSDLGPKWAVVPQ